MAPRRRVCHSTALRYPFSTMEESIPELAESIYRDRVLRARKQSIAERFEDGFHLFENALGMMRSGIRHQFPELDEDEVENLLRKRLRRLKQVHEHGIYKSVDLPLEL